MCVRCLMSLCRGAAIVCHSATWCILCTRVFFFFFLQQGLYQCHHVSLLVSAYVSLPLSLGTISPSHVVAHPGLVPVTLDVCLTTTTPLPGLSGPLRIVGNARHSSKASGWEQAGLSVASPVARWPWWPCYGPCLCLWPGTDRSLLCVEVRVCLGRPQASLCLPGMH